MTTIVCYTETTHNEIKNFNLKATGLQIRKPTTKSSQVEITCYK